MSEQEHPEKVAGMTPEDFEDIDDDGTVADPYQGIETYWCPLEMVGETDTFLRVIGDNGGTNVEIRVPLEQMRHNGWTPPKETVLERSRIAEYVELLERDRAALLAACKDAYEIIDVFLADQSGAKDPRCGLVQPVTVEDCNELGRVYNLLGIVISQAESDQPNTVTQEAAMTTLRELAEAVRELHRIHVSRHESIQAYRDQWRKVDAMLAEILDAPQPKPSATVVEMRKVYDDDDDVWGETVLCWANELEAAEQRVAQQCQHLADYNTLAGNYETQIKEVSTKLEVAERRIAELEELLLNNMRGVMSEIQCIWVEYGQYSQMKARIAELESQLAQQAKPAASDTVAAKAVIAAYEASRPREKVEAVIKTGRAVLHGFGSRADAEAFWADQNNNDAYEFQGAREWHYHPVAEGGPAQPKPADWGKLDQTIQEAGHGD